MEGNRKRKIQYFKDWYLFEYYENIETFVIHFKSLIKKFVLRFRGFDWQVKSIQQKICSISLEIQKYKLEEKISTKHQWERRHTFESIQLWPPKCVIIYPVNIDEDSITKIEKTKFEDEKTPDLAETEQSTLIKILYEWSFLGTGFKKLVKSK